MPNSLQAGVYSSMTHYLQAVKSAGTDATDPVMAAMKAAPVDDFFAHDGKIRADGLMVHDTRLFQVKAPANPNTRGIISSWSRRSGPIRPSRRSPNRNARWRRNNPYCHAALSAAAASSSAVSAARMTLPFVTKPCTWPGKRRCVTGTPAAASRAA